MDPGPMDDCPPDRRVLMERERQKKRKWVVILLKMTEQYVRAKFLQMNRIINLFLPVILQ